MYHTVLLSHKLWNYQNAEGIVFIYQASAAAPQNIQATEKKKQKQKN